MDASAGRAPDPEVADRSLVGLPATEIAARVRSGELSAVEVVRAHLAHLADVEPRIGAFRVVRTAAALAEAAAVDASPQRGELPLAGVPVAVKDNVAVTGEVATDGSRAHTPGPATADHPVVARLRAAGAVVVGITRAPELCLYAATDGPGTVSRNPWDTALSPAGSSGGSAAAGGRLRAGDAQARPRGAARWHRRRRLVGHGGQRRAGHHGRRRRAGHRGAGG